MEFIDYEMIPEDTIRKMPLNNIWCFKDKTKRVHTTNIYFKTDSNEKGNTLIIRTLEFFVGKLE